MSIRYPSLNEFWPAIRAKNFVKALGGKPGNYLKNMEFLAACAGVHVKQMDMVNPLTFADRNWLSARISTMIGMSERMTLEHFRQSTYHPSTKWAYAMKEPIPPYVDPAVDKWTDEKKEIRDFLCGFAEATSNAVRLMMLERLFTYMMTVEPFLRANAKFYNTLMAKVAEVKAEPAAARIMPIILKAEKFLIDISPSWAEAEALAQPQVQPLAQPQVQPLAQPLPLPPASPQCLARCEDYNYDEIKWENNLYNAIERYEEASKARLAEWNATNHMAVCQRAEELDLAFRRATLDGMDMGVLIQAAHLGHEKVVVMVGDLLVRDGVGVESSYGNQFTALMYAAQAGHINTVKELLARGADPTRKNSNGETATHRAIMSGFPETAILLLNAILATK